MSTENIQLTNNFYLKEYFVDRQNPAEAKRLFDECTDFQVTLAFRLAKDQQYMRDFINDMYKTTPDIALINTSGYRDPGLNAKQPGAATNSLHTKMCAVDFKTKNPMHLKKIYKHITIFSPDLDFRECFLYVDHAGRATNIHYALSAPGYTDRRIGVYVRPADGSKPIKYDIYVAGLLPSDLDTFESRYQRDNA